MTCLWQWPSTQFTSECISFWINLSWYILFSSWCTSLCIWPSLPRPQVTLLEDEDRANAKPRRLLKLQELVRTVCIGTGCPLAATGARAITTPLRQRMATEAALLRVWSDGYFAS